MTPQGQALRVWWDYEIDRRILEEEGGGHLTERGFDDLRRFTAFLHTLRWHCVTATDSNLFQSPRRHPHRRLPDGAVAQGAAAAAGQPVHRRRPPGLGKTIEAGLIARELLLRRKAKTIVVAASPSVLEQWKGELDDRFRAGVRDSRPRLPDTHAPRARFRREPVDDPQPLLVSHNLLIDPSHADPMQAWLGPLRPGSLLILDEAHHAAAVERRALRHRVEVHPPPVRDLAGRFEHRLFLSATPHNGHSNSFSTLLDLLDPYRFTRGVKVRGRKALEDVMVRRLKEDIRATQGGLALSRLLDEYRPPAKRSDLASHVTIARRLI